MLAEATKHHDESAERLEADISEAARLRAEAVAEAEQTKLSAIQEAEARIATAKKQATAISERTQQEFAWRKQQLRRETELLHQRKQAVLSQLASLSALAEQTANAFPDLDDPSDIESDQTVLRESDGPRQAGGGTPRSRPTTRRPRHAPSRDHRQAGLQSRIPSPAGAGAGHRRRRDGSGQSLGSAGRNRAPVRSEGEVELRRSGVCGWLDPRSGDYPERVSGGDLTVRCGSSRDDTPIPRPAA